MRGNGITLEEMQRLFKVLEQSKTNNDMQILIDNDMCKELQNIIEKTCIYKDKEIERLNNIIDELEKWLKKEADFWKQQQEKAIEYGWLEFGGKYNTTIIYENAIDKLKELKGETK